MKMSTIKALFVSTLFAFASQASADQLTNLGTLTPPVTLTYGNSFAMASSGTSFYDDYYFTIPDGSFNSIVSSINLGSIFGLSNLQARLYTSAAGSALVQGWGNTVNFAPGLTATTVVLNPTTLLTAGSYTLQIRGTVSGLAGGSYSGVLNVAPVPEPDSFAMILCGLGFIAYSLRKKVRVM
jgi:PEP-CTERM motif